MNSRLGLLSDFITRHWSASVFFGAGLVRLAAIGSEALWYDEAFTALVSQLPFDRMLAALAGDTHPSLWYLIEWGTVKLLGAAPAIVRLPAAAFGTAAVVVLYQLVRTLADDRAGQWASGLMAVLPAHVYYSNEARMYALLTFLVLAGAWAITTRRWFILAVLLALIPYTQTLGLMYSGLLALWGLWTSRGRLWRYLAIPAIAYLPQALITLQQIQRVSAGYWIVSPGNLGGLFYPLYYNTIYLRLPIAFQIHGILSVLLASAIALIVIRGQLVRLTPLLILAFIPPLALYVFSTTVQPLLVDRYLLPSGAALAGVWGVAASHLPRWAWKPTAAVAVPVLVTALATFFIDPQNQRANYFPAVDIIKDHWKPGDAIYHERIISLVEYDSYLQDLPSYTAPRFPDIPLGDLSDPTRQALGIKARERTVDQLVGTYQRLWFIGNISSDSSSREIATHQHIISTYRILSSWPLMTNRLMTIILYLLEL